MEISALGGPLDVGVHLPQVGALASRTSLVHLARVAEEVGLASVWVSDHIAFPTQAASRYPYSKDGEFPVPFSAPFLEMLTVLAFIAGVTERIRIGTSVLVLPLRSTLLTAKQIGTMGFLAPERLIVGVGVGWLKEEFEILGSQFGRRGKILEEQIEALRGLLTQDDFSFKGNTLSFPAVRMEPRPPAPPPIWVGGTASRALRRAGRLGDGWHAIGVKDPNELVKKMDEVRSAAHSVGRDPTSLTLSIRIGARGTTDGLDSLTRRLEAFERVGVNHAVVDPVYSSVAEGEEFTRGLGQVAANLSDQDRKE